MSDIRVLIVDDNPTNLKLARVLLVAEGYQVRTAADAEEALEILADEGGMGTEGAGPSKEVEKWRPHLILMDLQLPGMDGLELTRRLKGDPATREITILALTAYAMKGDEEKARAAGCDGYLAKPIDTRALSGILAGYLQRHVPTD